LRSIWWNEQRGHSIAAWQIRQRNSILG
jgi:hypothetical protein